MMTFEINVKDGNTRRDITFESSLTDLEVADRLRTMRGDFPQSLNRSYGRWSQRQQAWAHYLVWQAEQEKKSPTAPTTLPTGTLLPIVELFNHAARTLKYPKMVFDIDGQRVVIKRSGANSSRPGTLNVTDGRPFGDNKWYGRIELDGSSTVKDQTVLDFLLDFASDPKSKASIYGIKTGHCCFCGAELTEKVSVAVGYGPICAEKFGLPHDASCLPQHYEEHGQLEPEDVEHLESFGG